MIRNKGKILPQAFVEDNISRMSKLFKFLVKIYFFPIVIDKSNNITFKVSSKQFMMFQLIYSGIPGILNFISFFYYGVDASLAFIKEIFATLETTDAVSFTGYGLTLSFFLLGFYILMFKSLCMYKFF